MTGSSDFQDQLRPSQVAGCDPWRVRAYVVQTKHGSVRSYRLARHLTIEEREAYEQQLRRRKKSEMNRQPQTMQDSPSVKSKPAKKSQPFPMTHYRNETHVGFIALCSDQRSVS